MAFNLRKHNLKRLFYPKIISIDKPGMIINRNPGLFGSGIVITRAILNFEEVYHDLYFNSLKELGAKKTEDLWYRIGKDIAFRYFYPYKKMRINSKNILELLLYFSRHFSGAGMSVFENVKADFNNNFFIFNGKNTALCRGFGNSSCMAGFASGMVSFLLGKNIESKSMCKNCPNGCSIVVDKKIKERYISNDFEGLIKNNIPYRSNKLKFFSQSSSLSDLLRFRAIEINNEQKFVFKGKTLIPTEAGLPSVFYHNYLLIDKKDFYENSIAESSLSISNHIFADVESKEDKIRAIKNVASSFGWGEIYITKNEKNVRVSFLNPCFVNRAPSFVQFFFKGFLTHLYDKKFNLLNAGSSRFEYEC